MEGVGGDSTCGFPSMMRTVNNSFSGTGSSSSNRRVFLVPNLPFTTTSNNNSSSGGGGGGSAIHASMVKEIYSQNPNLCFMESNNNTVDHVGGGSIHGQPMKAKIMAHPLFPRLLAAYSNCQKVGAPPEVVARLEEVCAASEAAMSNSRSSSSSSSIGEDPALDQFMEAYCEMLSKYEQELTKPFKEAMLFLSRIDYQFKALTLASSSSDHHSGYGDFPGRNGSSEEDIDGKEAYIDPQAEEKELKGQLLRRYNGYLGNLKQEFLKKKKKGKLPKEARQQLLDWWTRHYKWPYPSETQKLALAESTGLDQKQINNWFINQRKRHWKPSEDMQFMVMDAAYPHYYMENVVGNPFPMDFTPAHL